MATTNVDHVTLTVSTVRVFKETMQFINEYELWDDAQAYLEEKGKTEMFVDCEALFYLHEMLARHPDINAEHPAFARIPHHFINYNFEPSS